MFGENYLSSTDLLSLLLNWLVDLLMAKLPGQHPSKDSGTAIPFGNSGMKWSRFCATAAQRTGPSVQRSQPCRAGSKGISKPKTWWGINLSETVWKTETKPNKPKGKKVFHTSLPGHIVGRFGEIKHINIGEVPRKDFRLAIKFGEAEACKRFNMNIKYLFTSHAPRIAKNNQINPQTPCRIEKGR